MLEDAGAHLSAFFAGDYRVRDIARVAVFLATDEARRITGELIHVNGGAYMA